MSGLCAPGDTTLVHAELHATLTRASAHPVDRSTGLCDPSLLHSMPSAPPPLPVLHAVFDATARAIRPSSNQDFSPPSSRASHHEYTMHSAAAAAAVHRAQESVFRVTAQLRALPLGPTVPQVCRRSCGP